MTRKQFLSPETWRNPTTSELTSFLEDRTEHNKPVGSIFGFEKILDPYFCYRYFYARFGPPNGMLTFLRKPNDSDNLYHWDWLIKAGDGDIYVVGAGRHVHVMTSLPRVGPKTWLAWGQNLKKSTGRHRVEIGRVSDLFEKWLVLPNRYARLADVAAVHYERLQSYAENLNNWPPKRSSERGLKAYQKFIQRKAAEIDETYSAALSLDLITPVLAEAYINLLIFICANEETRGSDRRMSSFIRQNVDLKVLDLHLRCRGFIEPVEEGSAEFKMFKRIMDRRNDIVHSNINPSRDAVETVYFDKFTPLFAEGVEELASYFKQEEKLIDVSGVMQRYVELHSFFIYIRDRMESSYRTAFELVLESATFGYDQKRNKTGVLFPNYVAAGMMPMRFGSDYV